MDTPSRVWLAIFGVWFLFLSGMLSRLTGTPGILQYSRLKNHLAERQEILAQAQTRVVSLKEQATRLETLPSAQEREIRKVLGYAAPGELFFDFR